MTETSLRLEHLALTDQISGNAMSETVQWRTVNTGRNCRDDGACATRNRPSRRSSLSGLVQKQPIGLRRRSTCDPRRIASFDERCGGRSERQSAGPTGLGGSEYALRHTAFDGEDSAVEISEPEHGQFAPPGPGVSGQTHKKEPLLGAEE